MDQPAPAASCLNSFQCLLDLDPDLAEALDVDMRREARQAATAVIFDAKVGDLRLAERLATAALGPGDSSPAAAK
ncbi:MAG: hypothetical protein ACRDNJ_07865 [Solirubrobacteraceae bacterium]